MDLNKLKPKEEVTKNDNPKNPVYYQLEKPSDDNKENNGSRNGSDQAAPLYFQLEKGGTEKNGINHAASDEDYNRLDCTSRSAESQTNRDDGTYQYIRSNVGGDDEYQHLHRDEL